MRARDEALAGDPTPVGKIKLTEADVVECQKLEAERSKPFERFGTMTTSEWWMVRKRFLRSTHNTRREWRHPTVGGDFAAVNLGRN